MNTIHLVVINVPSGMSYNHNTTSCNAKSLLNLA